ncbi:MAG: PHP domain-containing protein [Anaerolineae bacterium]|nr:PHP domain-containing protein [Anaerolineae bacterium]MDW8102842.1 PHP domain-containing protein [Anaerolineae bacterium]
MNFYPVDLHVHTSFSDGDLRPEEVVREAKASGIVVLGITDHDNLGGIEEALEEGKALGVEVVPGIEITVGEVEGGERVHILGYFINHRDEGLKSLLQEAIKARVEQKMRQIKLLQELGFNIDVEEVLARARGVPGRLHIAQVLLERNPDRFQNIQQIFDEYLSRKGKAYVRREYYASISEAAEAIHKAGGVAVLAHPGIYRHPDGAEEWLLTLKERGVMGLEVSYTYDKRRPYLGAPPEITEKLILGYSSLASRLGFLKTGGSDFHGNSKGTLLGEKGLTFEEFEELRRAFRR